METAAEIKVLARGEPVPLDLLVRWGSRTSWGSSVTCWIGKWIGMNDREWMETMQWLTVTEKTKKRPVTIRSRGVERDCRSIVNQLVNSMPKDVLLRTSFTEHRTLTQAQATEEVRVKLKSSFTRKEHFTDAKEEYEPSSECSSGDETMSGESGTFEPVQDDQGIECCPGAGFKATKEQSFVRVVEKHHRQIGT